MSDAFKKNKKDPQLQRVYITEWAFIETLDHRHLTPKRCQVFANQILKTKIWRELTPSALGVTVKIKEIGSDASHANWNGLIINLADQGRNKHTILHEMAHALTIRAYANKVQSHGPEWAWIYRSMLKEMLSASDFNRWEKLAFLHDVRWERPRGVNLVEA